MKHLFLCIITALLTNTIQPSDQTTQTPEMHPHYLHYLHERGKLNGLKKKLRKAIDDARNNNQAKTEASQEISGASLAYFQQRKKVVALHERWKNVPQPNTMPPCLNQQEPTSPKSSTPSQPQERCMYGPQNQTQPISGIGIRGLLKSRDDNDGTI